MPEPLFFVAGILDFIVLIIYATSEAVGYDYLFCSPLNFDPPSEALEAKYLAREGCDLGMQKIMVEHFDYKVRFDEFYRALSS